MACSVIVFTKEIYDKLRSFLMYRVTFLIGSGQAREGLAERLYSNSGESQHDNGHNPKAWIEFPTSCPTNIQLK